LSARVPVYVFIGAPGSGKGTLSALCVRELGWERLSTGELCRKHIAEKTNIGTEIDFAIKSGKLISDVLIASMVEQWFVEHKNNNKPVILDGYPRTVSQAEILNCLIAKHFPYIVLTVVHFLISQELLFNRLEGRRICVNTDCQAVYSLKSSELKPRNDMICDICHSRLGVRKDDQSASIAQRLHIYFEHEQSLLSYYHQQGNAVIEIMAERDPFEIFEDFKRSVAVEVA
jgi:adenylate kinase